MKVRIIRPVAVWANLSKIGIHLVREYPDIFPCVVIETMPEKEAFLAGNKCAVIPFAYRGQTRYVIKSELESSIGSV